MIIVYIYILSALSKTIFWIWSLKQYTVSNVHVDNIRIHRSTLIISHTFSPSWFGAELAQRPRSQPDEPKSASWGKTTTWHHGKLRKSEQSTQVFWLVIGCCHYWKYMDIFCMVIVYVAPKQGWKIQTYHLLYPIKQPDGVRLELLQFWGLRSWVLNTCILAK